MDASLFTRFAAVERTHWWFTARRDILLSVVERIVPDGGTILDVGCGTGFFMEALRPRYDAWGVDPSSIAARLCRERGLGQVVPGSAYDLSGLAGRSFHAICLLDVIEHLDDDRRALEEAIPLLKPGGRIIITVPAFMFLWSEHDVLNEHRRRYRRPQLESVLRDSGLEVERLSYFNFYLFGLATMDRLAHRLTRQPVSAELSVPPAPVNRLLRRTFLLERRRLADSTRRPFPFGLSLLAVGRRGKG